MTTAELIEKLERAEGPQYALFEAAWHAVYGSRDYAMTLADADFDTWYANLTKYRRMLDAGAWESAALMLVPEGWTTAMHQQDDGGWFVELKEGYCTSYRQVVISNVHSPYPPLANALCIAALKAKEADNG